MEVKDLVFLSESVVKATGDTRNTNLETMKNFFNASITSWNEKLIACEGDVEKLMQLRREMMAELLTIQETAALIVTNVIVPMKQNAAAIVVLSADIVKMCSEKTSASLRERDAKGEAKAIVERIIPREDSRVKASGTSGQSGVKLSPVEKAKIKLAENLVQQGVEAAKIPDVVEIVAGFIAAGMPEATAISMARSALKC